MTEAEGEAHTCAVRITVVLIRSKEGCGGTPDFGGVCILSSSFRSCAVETAILGVGCSSGLSAAALRLKFSRR